MKLGLLSIIVLVVAEFSGFCGASQAKGKILSSSRIEGVSHLADCFDQDTKYDCDLYTECTWCTSSTSSGSCYPIASKHYLPSRYTCDVKSDPQQHTVARPDNSVCDKRPEGDCEAPECVWCTSAAVGGGCYTADEAKLLPSAIFKCKKPAAL